MGAPVLVQDPGRHHLVVPGLYGLWGYKTCHTFRARLDLAVCQSFSTIAFIESTLCSLSSLIVDVGSAFAEPCRHKFHIFPHRHHDDHVFNINLSASSPLSLPHASVILSSPLAFICRIRYSSLRVWGEACVVALSLITRPHCFPHVFSPLLLELEANRCWY